MTQEKRGSARFAIRPVVRDRARSCDGGRARVRPGQVMCNHRRAVLHNLAKVCELDLSLLPSLQIARALLPCVRARVGYELIQKA